MGFMNGNKDTQGLCCPRVWVESFSEHFDVKTELSQLVGTKHPNTSLDTNVHSYNNNGDKSNKFRDGCEPTLRGNYCHDMKNIPMFVINTEADNCNSISGFKTQRWKKQVISRVGFIIGNKDTQGLCCPRVWDNTNIRCPCFCS